MWWSGDIKQVDGNRVRYGCLAVEADSKELALKAMKEILTSGTVEGGAIYIDENIRGAFATQKEAEDSKTPQ